MEQLLQPGIPQYAKLGEIAGSGIGILIPVYKRTPQLERTLWSIRQNLDVPAQLIVAEKKQSVAKNRRDALEMFDGDIVIFMDDDVILPPFFASKFLMILEHMEDAGVVSAIMTAPDGTRQNNVFCNANQILDTTPPGTCFCYSKKRVGDALFDIQYEGSQWEDTDFMLQVQARGLKTYAVGSVWILHDNNYTQSNNESWAKNKARFEKKWPGALNQI